MVVPRRQIPAVKGGAPVSQMKCLNFNERSRHMDSLIQILKQQGFDDIPFAVVALDGNGKAQVHASRQVREHLDEELLATQFQEAQTLSLERAHALSSASDSPVRLTEDDLMQQPHPFLRNTSRHSLRRAHHRGRSLSAPDPSPFGVSSYSYPTPIPSAGEEQAALTARGRGSIFKKSTMRSFRIDSEADVTAYLKSRLKCLQQLAGKKIAKAWIKGICPKKQARFPYQNQKRKNELGEHPRIPGWWPQEEGVCRFLEPDHIRREERMKLCLHLLRLRPTPQQLQAWNDNTTEPNKTHITRGWTEFLKELAGPDILDDLPREAPNRVELRKTLLSQMYTVAAMEEQYQNDEIDAGELYFCDDDEDDEEMKLATLKRCRRSSMESTREGDSRQSSVARGGNRVKRARRDVGHAVSQAESTHSFDSHIIADQELDQKRFKKWQDESGLLPRAVDVAATPLAPLTESQSFSRADQSPWTAVQTCSQQVQTCETPLGMAFAWNDPTISMSSRNRAFRAHEQALAQQLGNSDNPFPVKQELQAPNPPPQDQIRPFQLTNADPWVNDVSSYGPLQINNVSRSDAHPGEVLVPDYPMQQQYVYHHFGNTDMAPLPQTMPESHIYPAQAPLEQNMCLSLDCCPPAGPAAPHHVPSIPAAQHAPPYVPEVFDVGMPQPWEYQNPQELFYAPSEGGWGQRR